MGDKGLNIKGKQEAYEEFDTDRNSFLSLYMGFNLPLSKYDLEKATCSRPPPERRLQHPDPGEPWQQGVYAHHDTGS